MTKQRLPYLNWLRAFGVLMILMCHFLQQQGSAYFLAASQIFTIGNSIFFILSGFLFGMQGKVKQPVYKWYSRRFKRIYLPFELMLLVLLIASIIRNVPIDVNQWIVEALGMHGWKTVYGATQTWFITSILICYLFTPVISEIVADLNEKKGAIAKITISMCIIPFIIAYPLGKILDATIYIPLCAYVIAYAVGSNIEKIKITNKRAVTAFFLMCFGFVLRFAMKILFDDTIFYTILVVNFTQTFCAFCILYIFAVIFNKKETPKVVGFLSKYSFEIYLWHYMFTDGPLRLFDLTPFWITDCILVGAVSMAVAFAANKLLSFIEKALSKKKA